MPQLYDHSVHTHPKGDADLDYLKEQESQGLLVKSTDSKATFDLSLADDLAYYYLEDNILKSLLIKKLQWVPRKSERKSLSILISN